MRQISATLKAHLIGGATTLCYCWRVQRRDNTVLGFTDHDVALTFLDTTYEPAAGFHAGEIPANLGLNVDTSEINGALVSDILTAEDLNAGLYDNAEVQLWLVNWADLSQRVLLEVGSIGDITRQGNNFTAEIRSLTHKLDQERGRVFQSMCDASLGDARCKVNMATSSRSANGSIMLVKGERSFIASGITTLAASKCERGTITFTSGKNQNLTFDIRQDQQIVEGRLIELWSKPPHTLLAGDVFLAKIGCDKTFKTCRDLFSNTLNFRGFPHIPGADFALSYVRRGDSNDGGALQ